MRKLSLIVAASAGILIAGAASAEDGLAGTANGTFKGLRIEGQAGGDRFQSQGTHSNKFGWGAEAGWDGQIASKITVGPYGSYWHGGRGENVTTGTGGSGVVATKSFEEWGAGVRAGYQVMPKLLVFGQGGYVTNEQRRSFSGVGATGAGRFYDHYHTDGYQVGGGVEYSVMKNAYVKAAYKFSQYDDHTARQALYGGVGVRF